MVDRVRCLVIELVRFLGRCLKVRIFKALSRLNLRLVKLTLRSEIISPLILVL